MVLLTVVFILQSACVTQFLPAQITGQIQTQIPRQIILPQVITGQNLEEQQQDFFRIDEGRTAGNFIFNWYKIKTVNLKYQYILYRYLL